MEWNDTTRHTVIENTYSKQKLNTKRMHQKPGTTYGHRRVDIAPASSNERNKQINNTVAQ